MGFDSIAALIVLIGSVFGWLAFFRVRALYRRVRVLEQRVQLLTHAGVVKAEPIVSADTTLESAAAHLVKPTQPRTLSSTLASPPSPETSQYWTQHPLWLWLQPHWMVVLGGLCLALAGVFLARYAVQYGYLGPVARFSLGMLVGFSLHLLAEWLRRTQKTPHAALAALAGGGSITLFAMLLVGFHLFTWLHPLWIFVGLAWVALATLWLARLHGPVLAVLGMLGAYVVPLLVSFAPEQLPLLLLYSAIVSASVVALLRYVERDWLWYGWLVGAMGWWLVSLLYDSADGWRTLYLALLGYAMMALYRADYGLRIRSLTQKVSAYRVWQVLPERSESWQRWSLLLLVVASSVSLWRTGFTSYTVWIELPLLLLSLRLAWQHVSLCVLPWCVLIGQCIALLLAHSPVFDGVFDGILRHRELAQERVITWLFFAVVTSLVVVLSAWRQRQNTFGGHSWLALSLSMPLSMLLMTQHFYPFALSAAVWSSLIGLVGLLYGFSAARRAPEQLPFVVIASLLANIAYAAAFVIALTSASLTLALAVQCLSVAWFIRRFQLPQLAWLLKAVAAIVVLRLTTMPWWSEMNSLSALFITYYGSMFILWLTSRQLLHFPLLRAWAEAATLHVAVLALWFTVRGGVYQGQPFAMSLSLLDAALSAVLFGLLALVYFHKQRVSVHLRGWYQGYSQILLVLSLCCLGVIIVRTAISDYWFVSAISTTPIWNTLWVVYAAPALVALASYRYSWPAYRVMAAGCSGVLAFLFITLQIRHLWQGHVRLSGAFAEGELYTYSAVWLLLALLVMLVGGRIGLPLYQVGVALMLLVVAKVFLIDLEHLQGVYRILAFLGLGLGLLLVALLHKHWVPLTLSKPLAKD